jgi:uncharacterized protein YcfJ
MLVGGIVGLVVGGSVGKSVGNGVGVHERTFVGIKVGGFDGR